MKEKRTKSQKDVRTKGQKNERMNKWKKGWINEKIN